MKREEKKEVTGRLYREFSRQKYNKYKHQFPRLRESELIAKIIKEWESLDNVAKENLQRKYEEHKFLTMDQIEESEAMAKKEKNSTYNVLKAKQASTPESPLTKTPNVKIYVEKAVPKPPSSESADYLRISERAESQFDSSEERLIILPKTKKIRKEERGGKRPANSDYLDFYKYYYDKLKAEHPGWVNNQIVSIVKLLWRKRNLALRGKRLRAHPGLRRGRRFDSGRTYFRKLKNREGVPTPQATTLWFRLPKQNKLSWTRQAKGEATFVKKRLQTKQRLVPKNRDDVETVADLSFMRKTIA